jgi:hypothetical protein
MIIDVKSPRGMNPDLEDLARCNGRLLAQKKKEQNKHNTLMFVPITKN